MDQTTPEGTSRRPDHRQALTDEFVTMLEAGVSPWQKPWKGAGRHHNPVTGTVYSGGNALGLRMAASQHGYADPRWLTMRQIVALNIKTMQDQGIEVELRPNGKSVWPYNAKTGRAIKFADWPVKLRVGSQGARVEYWKSSEGKPDKGLRAEEGVQGESPGNKRLSVFYSTVFNASCVDGMPPAPERKISFTPVELVEQASTLSGVPVVHSESDRACYSPQKDRIEMPPRDVFATAEGFYSTLLHEHVHATGHASRLARPGITQFAGFGTDSYAKEELRAELGSVFLAQELGLGLDMGSHAAYLGSWLEVLKKDKNELFRASADASKAADHLLQPLLERGLLPGVVTIDLGDLAPKGRDKGAGAER